MLNNCNNILTDIKIVSKKIILIAHIFNSFNIYKFISYLCLHSFIKKEKIMIFSEVSIIMFQTYF